MSKSGSYSINESEKTESSLKSFFCIILIFLAMLLLIYLLMVALKETPGKSTETKTDGGKFAKLLNGEGRFNEIEASSSSTLNNSDEEKEAITSTKPTESPKNGTSTAYPTAPSITTKAATHTNVIGKSEITESPKTEMTASDSTTPSTIKKPVIDPNVIGKSETTEIPKTETTASDSTSPSITTKPIIDSNVIGKSETTEIPKTETTASDSTIAAPSTTKKTVIDTNVIGKSETTEIPKTETTASDSTAPSTTKKPVIDPNVIGKSETTEIPKTETTASDSTIAAPSTTKKTVIDPNVIGKSETTEIPKTETTASDSTSPSTTKKPVIEPNVIGKSETTEIPKTETTASDSTVAAPSTPKKTVIDPNVIGKSETTEIPETETTASDSTIAAPSTTKKPVIEPNVIGKSETTEIPKTETTASDSTVAAPSTPKKTVIDPNVIGKSETTEIPKTETTASDSTTPPTTKKTVIDPNVIGKSETTDIPKTETTASDSTAPSTTKKPVIEPNVIGKSETTEIPKTETTASDSTVAAPSTPKKTVIDPNVIGKSETTEIPETETTASDSTIAAPSTTKKPVIEPNVIRKSETTEIPKTETTASDSTTPSTTKKTVIDPNVIGKSETTEIPKTETTASDSTAPSTTKKPAIEPNVIGKSETTEIPKTETTASDSTAPSTTKKTVIDPNVIGKSETTEISKTETTASDSTAPSTTKKPAIEPNAIGKSETMEIPKTETTASDSTIFIPPPNMPPCEHPVCKRAASKLLSLMNHDEGTRPCEDFYEYSCGGQTIMEESFFQQMFDGLVKSIQDVTATSEKYLLDLSNFYQSCTQFETSFGMMERLEFLKESDSKTTTNKFIDMILTQSMPFFDIGLSISDSKFIFQVTIPETGALKTSLRKWSVNEQIKEECLQEGSERITDNTIYLKETMDYIKKCIEKKTEDYIRSYAKEMRIMSKLPDMAFLYRICSEENEDDLVNIMKHVQYILLSNYKTNLDRTDVQDCKITTLAKFNENIVSFGMNWTELFQGISSNNDISDNTPVQICHLDYLNILFQYFKDSSNLEGILKLWSIISSYRNTIIDHRSLKRQTFCMKLATELMPDVATVLVHKLAAKQRTETSLKIIEDLFNKLKLRFEQSLEKVDKNGDSKEAFRKRLQEINMTATIPDDLEFLKTNYENVDISKDSYQSNVKNLIENYRKTLFSLVHQIPTPETLLKYFVNPFDTKPRIFYPVKYLVYQPGFSHGVYADLPDYTKLATKAFPLAKQLLTFFKNSGSQPPNDATINLFYEFLNNGRKPIIRSESKFIEEVGYGFDGKKYAINNTGCEGQCLNSDEMEIDNAAFRLVAETFQESKNQAPLIYLDKSFDNDHIFFILTAQDFCNQRSLVDFLRDFYDGRLPAPIKIKNMMKNSKLFDETYKCFEL